MGLSSSPEAPPRWTFQTRGAFTFGVCLVCGFRTPARRARYSAESDLKAHELLCEATRSLEVEAVGDRAESTER